MIALIDYGMGSAGLVANVLDELKYEYQITDRESDLLMSEKIILPDSGEALCLIRRLHVTNLITMLRLTKKPVLGIGLGMQILCDKSSEESGSYLGIFPVTTEKFDETRINKRLTGLNKVKIVKPSNLFDGIEDDENFYFDNSVYVPVNNFATSICNYGIDFCASIEKDNFYGIQFQPEKSGQAGIQLIKNFVEIC